jgi:predicted AAA+ superfamily ATPase
VSLDEFEIRTLAKGDPGLFLQQYPPPLIIDEIQYAPELFPYIKADVDRTKRMGGYWLTGSQYFHLMKNVSESLAGRIGIVKLLGMSYGEEQGIKPHKNAWTPERIQEKGAYASVSIRRLFHKIIRGSFPRLIHKNAPPLDSFYGSYVQTYIDRDLRDLVRTGSLSSFEKFIKACAARTASVLNISDIARDAGISVNTAKEWLSLLEGAGQIFLLQPYYKNLTKRLIKAPKLYFLDTGMCAYLTGWRDADTAMRGAFAGAFFETYIIAEILKSYWHRGTEPRLFYFRTKEKREVDVLIEKNGTVFPVEIKLASRIREEDIKGIRYLQTLKLSVGKGAIIAMVRQMYPFNKDVTVAPPTVIN